MSQQSATDGGGSMPWRAAQVSAGDVAAMTAATGVPWRVARWLCARGFTPALAAQWLAPADDIGLSPEWLNGVVPAVARLLAAAANGERVAVVGDYDVDGVTATVILGLSLTAVGADWVSLIPHRVNDGYGLSTALVERAAALGASVLVTVDNGIRAGAAVDMAVAQAMDVIITDHHEPGDAADWPTGALAVVHFQHSRDPSACAVLSGAGVALKLGAALEDASDRMMDALAQRERREWQEGLAALGAIADVMPLIGETRRIVRRGICALQRCSRPGWLALCATARVAATQVSATSLAWQFTPRLNAAGRMGTAEVAVSLLQAEETAAAANWAAQVEAWNTQRRQVTEEVAAAAQAQLDACGGGDTTAGIVLAGTWPLGVIGIVAARLCTAYGRPVIIFCDDGSPVLRGSGRTPSGFPLHESLRRCAHTLTHFGGHDAAVGCAVERHLLDAFRSVWMDIVHDLLAASELLATQPSDAGWPLPDDYLPLADATLATTAWMERIGPFGPANEPFRFYVGPVSLLSLRKMGNGAHLRLRVAEAGVEQELVWFRAPAAAFAWRRGDVIVAVAELEENVWAGARTAQLRIVSAQTVVLPIAREQFVEVYRLLRARRRITMAEAASAAGERALAGDGLRQRARLQIIFDTFVELGFARVGENGYDVNDNAPAHDLREASTYQRQLMQANSAGVGAS